VLVSEVEGDGVVSNVDETMVGVAVELDVKGAVVVEMLVLACTQSLGVPANAKNTKTSLRAAPLHPRRGCASPGKGLVGRGCAFLQSDSPSPRLVRITRWAAALPHHPTLRSNINAA